MPDGTQICIVRERIADYVKSPFLRHIRELD